MTTKFVKVSNQDVYDNFESYLGFRLAQSLVSRKNLECGKVVFSLKSGKRRKLVKGFLYVKEEYTGQNRRYYFCPRNREKFLNLLKGDR